VQSQLRISGYHYNSLRQHLLTSDGKEAVAVALCGRMGKETLLIHDVILIPYHECEIRNNDVLKWKTNRIRPYFEKISKYNFALLKIHSHPGGYENFSEVDDSSDREFFESVFGWTSSDCPHASAIMLPSGKIFGRLFFPDLSTKHFDRISITGDSIKFLDNSHRKSQGPNFATKTIQVLGEATFDTLHKMSIAVVGCSGTGSPIIEQLVRLGVDNIILVDPDIVEAKNLNRILNTTLADANAKRKKVEVLQDAILRMGLGTKVKAFATNLFDDVNMLRELSLCDVVFGCMDTVDGRYLLNQLCTYYILPYFDLGVKLEADGHGGIKKICMSVNYLQPGKSSLVSRGIYTMEDVRAASQYRKSPAEYASLLKNKYITNININRPAVISVNMQIASHAINEFLNRIHGFKAGDPSDYAQSTIDLTEGYMLNSNETEFTEDIFLQRKVGRGDTAPFIDLPELHA
jgi:hypothetical protein